MFFIVGRGRSGTTLLARMLSAHPEVCVAPESTFVMSLHGAFKKRRWDSRAIEEFHRSIWLESKMARWKMDEAEVLEALRRGSGATFAALCERVYEAYAAQRGKPGCARLGDKNPIYSLFIPQLRTIFPGARFVHLVRDPRDNVASFMEVSFDASRANVLAHRWNHYNRAIIAARLRDPRAFVTVRYEDLVRHPKRVLQKIFAHIGVCYSPEALAYHREPADEATYMFDARPVHAESVGRWSAVLSAEQARTVSEICGPTMRELGYDNPQPSGSISTGGRAAAAAYTAMERAIFKLPLRARSRVVDLYRRATTP